MRKRKTRLEVKHYEDESGGSMMIGTTTITTTAIVQVREKSDYAGEEREINRLHPTWCPVPPCPFPQSPWAGQGNSSQPPNAPVLHPLVLSLKLTLHHPHFQVVCCLKSLASQQKFLISDVLHSRACRHMTEAFWRAS